MECRPIPALVHPRPDEELLFECCRQHLLPTHVDRISEIVRTRGFSWDDVWSVAVNHGVAPLIWSNLQKCDGVAPHIPSDIRDQFERCSRHNKLLKSLFAQRTRGVLEFFGQRSINVLLLKGAALDATVYRQPWYTLSSDIDLMIPCLQSEYPTEDLPALHALVRGRTVLERHATVEFEWARHHDVSMNGLLPVDYADVWRRARPIHIEDQTAFVMCPEQMLLAACINSCRKRFFRLKCLCDINETVRANEIDWDLFARMARQWRCEAIVYAALLIASMTLECPVPLLLHEDLGIPMLRRQLISFVCRRRSFTSLASIHSGRSLWNRQLGLGLVLPLVVYRWPQVLRNLLIVGRGR